MERRAKRVGCWLLGIGLWTFFPLISVLLASAIGAGLGCRVDEGSASSCVVAGTDIGELLYSMFVMGWLFFLTIPTGVAAAAVLLVVLVMARWKRRAKEVNR
jgi:hypothetical protein